MKNILALLFAPRHWRKRFPFLMLALACSLAYFMYQGYRYYEMHQMMMDLRNIHTAGQWYRYGADRNIAEAQYNLGLLYRRGLTVEQNDQEAAKWIRKASDQDLGVAQNELGTYYETGIGVTQNYAEAFKLYTLAANHNIPNAMDHLADLHLAGNGTPLDKSKATGLYEKAAMLGFIPSQISLAEIYEKDDPAKAFAWVSVVMVSTGDPDYMDEAGAVRTRLLSSMSSEMLIDANTAASSLVAQYSPITKNQFLNRRRK